LVPAWKIEREWRRLKEQFLAFFSRPFVKIRNRRFDKNRSAHLKLTNGQGPWGKKCAILLLFQPKGLLKSTYQTIDELKKNGFSVFIVSNVALSKADRDQLSLVTSLIMERPNIGYDFGGYRDGILHILDNELQFENLLVMNDSIWFPAVKTTTMLSDLLDLESDVSGPILQFHPRNSSKDHLQSYMVNYSKSALDNPKFRAFWANFSLPLNRYEAIRSGEMKLTSALKNMGLTISSLYRSDDIKKKLPGLIDQEIIEALPFLKWKSNEAERTVRGLDFSNPAFMETLRSLIQDSLRHSAPLDTHPVVLLKALGLPFLKKDRNVAYQKQRAVLKDHEIKSILDDEVLREIETWDAQ